MIGISSYLNTYDESYLKKASEIGVNYVFTSLHIQEEHGSLIENFQRLQKSCQNYSMTLIPDISPVTFEKLKLNNNDFKGLKLLGLNTVRIDYGFTTQDIIDMSQYFDIILNASVVTEAELIKVKEGISEDSTICVMHNFYPKNETGLSEEYFERMNQPFKNLQIEIMAFVSGDKTTRYPCYEGVPTLECHRYSNSYVSCVELASKYGIEHIIVGDIESQTESLKWMVDFLKHNRINIPVYVKKEYQSMFKNLKPRKEINEDIIRLNSPRVSDIQAEHMVSRYQGAITVENIHGGRYCGEIQIVKKRLKGQKSANAIGFVHPEYVGILPYISANYEINFVFKGEL